MDCPKCGFSGSETEVISHHTKVHVKGIDERYSCEDCYNSGRKSRGSITATFDTAHGYFIHRVKKHGDNYSDLPDRIKEKLNSRNNFSCQECEKEFLAYRSRQEVKFCSQECYNSFRGDKETFNCEYCGKKTERYPSQVRGENTFCSTACTIWFYRGRSEDNLYYGKNWKEIREKCIERDFGRCRLCNISRKQCKNKFNTDLHVHHRTPFRYFDDRKKANRLRNLISLCPPCHAEIEFEIRKV